MPYTQNKFVYLGITNRDNMAYDSYNSSESPKRNTEVFRNFPFLYKSTYFLTHCSSHISRKRESVGRKFIKNGSSSHVYSKISKTPSQTPMRNDGYRLKDITSE